MSTFLAASDSGVSRVFIEFDAASYAFPDGRHLLQNISLYLNQGTTTAFLGRSGAGKTTLLRMVNGLVMPTQGEVRVRGKATTAWDAILLRRSIGYVIQESGLFPHMTAGRNAGMSLELTAQPRETITTKIAELFTQVGLDPEVYLHRFPSQLSGGQRQRVGLARALAADPDILLMDEPFGALDPVTRAEMQRLVRNLLLRLKKAVLLVTHDLEEALYLASRIVLLEAGQVVADLPSHEFPGSRIPAVREYLQAIRREPSGTFEGDEQTKR